MLLEELPLILTLIHEILVSKQWILVDVWLVHYSVVVVWLHESIVLLLVKLLHLLLHLLELLKLLKLLELLKLLILLGWYKRIALLHLRLEHLILTRSLLLET